MSLEEFELAIKRMSSVVHHTQLERSETFSQMTGGSIFLKYENQQKTGAFKVRGAFNKLSKLKETNPTIKGVVACSAGNHAQGIAFASTYLGISSTIVMPRTAPLAKVNATKGYGATVILHGDCFDDCLSKTMEIAEKEDLEYVPPFDDDDVIAGQGTIALEILHDLSTVDIIVVSAGGGGLLAGIAACTKLINPRVKVIGVQAKGADAIYRSFHSKQWTSTETASTIADGIAVKKPGVKTFELIQKYVDDVVTVTDEEIATSVLLLIERCKEVVEPAGAASLAAVLSKKIDVQKKKVACVLSGGNIDVSFIQKIIEKGLFERGRRISIGSVLPDSPGSLQKFLKIISDHGGNVIDVSHGRSTKSCVLNQCEINISLEVGGAEQSKIIVFELEKSGYVVEITQ